MSVRSRWVAGTAVLAVVTLALSGCFLLPDRPQVVSPDPETSDSPFAKYFEQELDWEACDSGLLCADIDVPIDWEDASSDSVTIALAKQEAGGSDGSKGTIFVNPGGPGGSGVEFVPYAVSLKLADNFDVIGWDPRGVGASTQVECFTDDADKDEALYGTFDDPYFTEGWIDELEQETADYAEACADNTGPLLGKLDTVSTAHDLELMRALVNGDKPLDYLGYSYGTFIGATYAELFPEHVGKFVLDGAVDPTLDAFDTLLVQMTGFENGFRAYMEDCLDSADCPFSGSLQNALDDASELIGSVDGEGLESTDGRLLDSATVGTGVAMALYSEDYWPYLSDLFDGIKGGDADPSFLLADNYNGRDGSGDYADNSNDVYVTTTCVDNDFAADPESTIDRLDEIEAAAPTIGRYIALDDYALLDVACSNWPFEPAQHPATYDATGAAPILVIGTSNDPATPYAWAKSLASQLDSGVLISVEGEGHTAYNGGNSCVDSVVDTFFLDNTVPDEDPEC